MKRRLCALLSVVFVVCALLCGCGANAAAPVSYVEDEDYPEQLFSGVTFFAHKSTGIYDIYRAEPGGSPLDVEKDSWTIFVYLCGSDLESGKGAASRDVKEMLETSWGDKVTIVLETGGTKQWHTDGLDATQLERYVIRGGQMELVESLPLENMGDRDTLGSFLTWGVTNYPADHMGVVLWDHGGGSAKGVCLDENYDFESLQLRELDQGFGKAFRHMDRKFEFVGFDACLMGTMECANIIATYANYMIASQEWEPGTGWPYVNLLDFISSHLDATGAEIGRAVCDAFIPKEMSAERAERLSTVTLATYDLSKMDDLLHAFNNFSVDLFAVTSDNEVFARVTRAINEVENFGGNNRREGFTNMVDLGGVADTLQGLVPSSPELRAAIEEVVIYKVSGPAHVKASGMSFFYPLRVGRSRQLELFQSICVNPSYLAFMDRIVSSMNDAGSLGDSLQNYSDEGFYTDGEWTWITENNDGEDDEGQDYWNSFNENPTEFVMSDRITFAKEPVMGNDATVSFVLDRQGVISVMNIGSMYYEFIDDDKLFLGGFHDVDIDWQTGEGKATVSGMWPSLPDGQNLSIIPVDSGKDCRVYSSSILLNGEKTNLRLRFFEDGRFELDGVWAGINECGFADRGIEDLVPGDVIEPLYVAVNQTTQEASYYAGEPFEFTGDLPLTLKPLDPDYYGYALFFEDLFGGVWMTDTFDFVMDEGVQIENGQ